MKTRIAQLNNHRHMPPSQRNHRDEIIRKLIVIIAMLMVIGLLVWQIG